VGKKTKKVFYLFAGVTGGLIGRLEIHERTHQAGGSTEGQSLFSTISLSFTIGVVDVYILCTVVRERAECGEQLASAAGGRVGGRLAGADGVRRPEAADWRRQRFPGDDERLLRTHLHAFQLQRRQDRRRQLQHQTAGRSARGMQCL